MDDSRLVTVKRSTDAVAVHTPGDVSYLGHIRELVCDLAHKVGFPSEDIAKIEMAVDEACTNIVEHAYAPDANWRWQQQRPEIRIVVRIAHDQLIVELNDHGQHFDFAAYRPANVQDRAQNMQTGGYGIAIMRQFMDEVVYTSSDAEGNTLRLVKYLKKT